MDEELVFNLVKSIAQKIKLHLTYIVKLKIDNKELSHYLDSKIRGLNFLEEKYQQGMSGQEFQASVKGLNPASSLLDVYGDYLRIEPGLISSNNWKKNRQNIIEGFEKIMPDITKLDGILRELKSKL